MLIFAITFMFKLTGGVQYKLMFTLWSHICLVFAIKYAIESVSEILKKDKKYCSKADETED